ncbi:MAG: type II toxin-antitoxin system Phd/YefM family antitoxin [Gammaproteobacteria bacterium]
MGESIISLSEFKSEASQLLARIRESGEAIVLTQNGTATAVVHDIASFRKLEQGLLMLKLLVQGEADIRRNRVVGQRDVFNSLRKELERGKASL